MSTDDNTPVEIPRAQPNGQKDPPGRTGSLSDISSIPVALPFEESDKFATALYEQVEGAAASLSEDANGESITADNIIDVLAKKLIAHGGGGGGGGVPPEDHKKSIKRHNWISVVLALLLGPGGAFAVIKATEDRSKTNEHKVKTIEKKVEAEVTPRLSKTEEDVGYIKVRIGQVDEKVDKAMIQQTAIVDGIEELKKENVNRLKEEKRALERQLERARRRRR